MGIFPIIEFQNLKQSGHSDFQEKKTIWNWVVKDWSSMTLLHPIVLWNTCGA